VTNLKSLNGWLLALGIEARVENEQAQQGKFPSRNGSNERSPVVLPAWLRSLTYTTSPLRGGFGRVLTETRVLGADPLGIVVAHI